MQQRVSLRPSLRPVNRKPRSRQHRLRNRKPRNRKPPNLQPRNPKFRNRRPANRQLLSRLSSNSSSDVEKRLQNLARGQVLHEFEVCFEEVVRGQVFALGPLDVAKDAVLELAAILAHNVKAQLD